MSQSKYHSKPFLYIPSDIYGEVMGLVTGCEIEISWFGQLKQHKDGMIVTKIHLLDQECTGVTTEMKADAIAKIEYECEFGKYKQHGQLMWWGHSHVDMECAWSGTDMSTITGYGKHKGGRMVATVFNKHREMTTAYQQAPSQDGIYPAVFMNHLKTVIVPSGRIAKDIHAKVQVKKYQVPKSQNEIHKEYDHSRQPDWVNEALNRYDVKVDQEKFDPAPWISKKELECTIKTVSSAMEIEPCEVEEMAEEYEYEVERTKDFDCDEFMQWIKKEYLIGGEI